MSSDLYEAVKNSNWNFLDNFIKNGGDINEILFKTGPKTGYSALHLATMENDVNKVKKIIQYGGNVNCVAQNGAQPLHLAFLTKNYLITELLFSAGANPDAELPKELFVKFGSDKKWSDEFSIMTLLVYGIVNNIEEFVEQLLNKGADFNIKSKNNKTLLMFAIENDNCFLKIVQLLILKMKNYQKLINAKDDNNKHVIHYLFNDNRYWHGMYFLVYESFKIIIDTLIDNLKLDINLTINGDPDTLLVNMAGKKSCEYLIKKLIKFDSPLNVKWRPLYYLSVQPEIIGKIFGMEGITNSDKRSTVAFIVEDYKFREEFGLFVPEEEIKLIDYFAGEDKSIKKIIDNFVIFVDFMKKKKINDCLSLYDFVMNVLDDKKIKIFVKNENLMTIEDFKYSQVSGLFFRFIFDKLEAARKKMKLLERVQGIENLRNVLPLPYEIILEIIEFVDNESSEKFVQAFYE